MLVSVEILRHKDKNTNNNSMCFAQPTVPASAVFTLQFDSDWILDQIVDKFMLQLQEIIEVGEEDHCGSLRSLKYHAVFVLSP